MGVITPWISKRIQELLGDEDEVIVNFITSGLEKPRDGKLDPRKLQIDITGI
jgi:PWI domain